MALHATEVTILLMKILLRSEPNLSNQMMPRKAKVLRAINRRAVKAPMNLEGRLMLSPPKKYSLVRF